MNEQIEIEIPSEFEKTRLDLALVKLLLNQSRSQISKWIELGAVTVNGELKLKPAFLVEVGDLVTIEVPSPEPSTIVPDPTIKLDIVYEDPDIMLINKQAGLVVHPAAGNWSKTLVNALAAHLGQEFAAGSLRPGIVHRLDKDTSGLMLIAKTQLALQNVAAQFLPPRKISREYIAIASSHLPAKEGTIDAPISRHPVDRFKMAVSETGRIATTHWKVEQDYSCGASRVRLKLETGRTHQIRVHLQYKKAPIIGDMVYGPSIGGLPAKLRKTCQDFPRQALHATRLSFEHPKTSQIMSFESEIPEDMQGLVSKLATI